ncbi:MAG: hypothetical protein HDQ91_05920 [Desulfovibrio sp.]|nr:hypothetical protein [Desulfovibrio sp.]
MTKNHAILAGPLVLGLLAIAFCIWSALGNDVNICVTTGCTLYEDFSIAGISLWWVGTAAFAILCIFALLGQREAGRFLAGLFLLGDIGLLLLMAFTAPCVSCLVIALFFALSYFLFRRQGQQGGRNNQAQPLRPSILLWVWLALFVVNLGQVARSQLDVWPILAESDDGNLRMFFSPECRYCIQGIDEYSGNINVSFYPIAENEAEIAQIDRMIDKLNEGMSLAEALAQSRGASFDSFWSAWNPDTILLRFRLLRNKAHIFAQGSQSVPFFERKGLPVELIARESKAAGIAKRQASPSGGDENLPEELLLTGQCGGQVPCPPAN